MSNLLLKLFIAQMKFLGTREKILLYECFDSLEAVRALSLDDISKIINRKIRVSAWDAESAYRIALSVLECKETEGTQCVFYDDAAYPSSLKEIYDPPYVLFYKGFLPCENSVSLAVVGTRKPNGAANLAAFRLGFEAASLSFPLISGMALGIDAQAHWGAVKSKAYTAAVLGTGVDVIYPKTNTSLAYKILDNGGALISEYFPGTMAARYNFPARNRIISGLSQAVVIVQAPAKSGALFTADYALEQGRDVFVHESGLYGSGSGGTLNLSKEGATVISSLYDLGNSALFNIKNETFIPDANMPVNVGLYLAKLLEDELAGNVIRHSGTYFRRA